MKSYILTKTAKQDLSDIWDYIAIDSIEAAERLLDELEAAVTRIAKSPGIGHWREDLADKQHRFYLVHSYLIVYRVGVKRLEVIRILHASRDIQGILSPGVS